ncbi:MAG: polysaccharide biosynthesis/export family protein [Flavobacterium sp.]|nr:polysaccharide biosynthesis/export family protein [Flavobacterium sp.]
MIEKKIVSLLVVVVSVFCLSSCVTNKNIAYFPTLHDTTFLVNNSNLNPKIQAGDIIVVIVNSPDPKTASLFNAINNNSISGIATASSISATPGLLVERDGSIIIPKVGKLQVAGKTKQEVIVELQNLLIDYIKDPIVTIRFMNYRITVLGEVAKPGVLYTTNEKMTILEALGQSGDITNFGNRKNLLLIRDSANFSVAHRINILNNSVFNSPYFNLQPNDVLYVEPLKQKAYSSSQAVILIPIISSVLTSILLIYSLFKK